MIDGVVKSPPYGVAAVFRDLDIRHVCLHPRKTTTPCGAEFLLSRLISFCEGIMVCRLIFILTLLIFSTTTVFAANPKMSERSDISSVEERRVLVSIEDEYAKLGAREEKIATQEMALKTLEAEVDKKLATMQQLRDQLVKLLDRKGETEGERIGELSKIYEKMAPQKAAVLIKSLDHQLAVELLLGIKKKIAGKILDNLDPDTATTLSNAFTEIPVNE